MDERSPRAPAEIDEIKSILGQWDVEVTLHPTDSTMHKAEGRAEISYMNRGYAYMSRLHIPSYDPAGNEANLIQFLNFTPTNQTWVMGEANSYTESISMYNGDRKGKKLVLSTATRKNGGPDLTHIRVTYGFASNDSFSITRSTSKNAGSSWTQELKMVFSRRTPSDNFMATHNGAGKPSPERPEETAQFDFLLGVWQSSHKINLNGQWIQFPANATAVYALNGHGILEYNWYDVDPSHPDAATTIVRLYNRSMRRWESLYLDNRGNSPLFFGGQKDGDEIVLHNFEATTADPIIPRYVFHSIADDSYAWYATNSNDRGKTFNEMWNITFTRVKTDLE